MITTPNGISTNLFGPWIRADNKGSLQFINVPDERDRRSLEEEEKEEEANTDELAPFSKQKQIDSGEEQSRHSSVRARMAEAEFENTKLMCP